MKRFILIVCSLIIASTAIYAQRIQQKLGRGVVAVQNGTNVMVTWRKLAQEPEDCSYNVYVKKNGGDFTKVNSSPIKRTNFSSTTTSIPLGSEVAVKMVTTENGTSVEHELSTPFLFKSQNLRNIYMEISFASSPLDMTKYTTKFVWPCDLDGNGEMDYVVDRCPVDGTLNYYVEAYLADGTFLWNVDLGPNEKPCDGQNDNMCAYDIDCDGYGELIVQTSDGTRFWDKAAGTWGKYVLGKSTGDSDGDGIINYETQTTKNPPRYMTVIDGMTGAEKSSAEFAYDVSYNRTNKASLMGEEYNKHEGHVGIFYNDGVHPAIVGEWHTRSTSDIHYYRNAVFAYDFINGKATNWHQLSNDAPGGAVFHMIRIADVDGDGCDEMLSGAYAMDNNGKTLYNSGISHGDRHRTSDIDPERPGLETFSIQQYAPDMLGQILFDAAPGEPIKKWYLPVVGDVGRGECMDVDKNHLGWEMWSTMDGVYDAKGDRIDGLTNVYPTEGMWWDGELDREILQTSDSHYNFYFQDYGGGRIVEPAKASGYTLKTSYGKRGKFWGDIIGDWREELVVIREVNGVCQGIVGLTTDIATTVNNIYCLQEDPHYRGDCTTRGYYQSPNPGFYLGYDMPRPQLPPCMVTDAVAKADGTYTDYMRSQTIVPKTGATVLYDLTLGNAEVSMPSGAGSVYAMPVKGQTVTMKGDLTGNADLWKSQLGTLVYNGNSNSTGTIYISEGILEVNGTITSNVELRARGTLAGHGVVNALTLEGALNYEGGRIMPKGTLTFANGLTLNKKTYIETNIDDKSLVKVVGDLSVTKPVVLTIVSQNPTEGEYKLIEYSGAFAGAESNFSVRGLTGLSYNVVNKDGAIYLIINGQREPANDVMWVGNSSNLWDYQTNNFTLNDEATTYVAGDGVVFGDDAMTTTINIDELMPIGSATFVNNTKTYTIQGDGGISGTGDVVMNGNGRLVLNATKSDYTGKTIINSGTVTVKELADGGIASSIGAASSAATNFQIGKATLVVNNANTATDRGITLTDTATISNASGVVALKGIVQGAGTLLKAGAGQLNITYAGANTWSGTILQAGTLAMGAWNTTFGKATSPILVTGNSTIAMFDNNTTSAIPTFQNVLTIDKGKTLTFKAGSRCTVKGTLKGEGTYKISFPYVRGDVSTNTSAFEGTYEVASSNCRFVQAMDMSKATLKMDDGSYAAGVKAGSGTEQSYTHKIGAISGTGTLGTSVWNVGYLGKDDTFGGVFNSAATVNKYGDGKLSLTGASAASINVYAGELQANCTSASTTSGTITVRSGAILAGSGQAQNVSVLAGGTVGAGKSSAVVATLTVNGNLTVASGGHLRLRMRSAATRTNCDAFKVAGNVKLTSPVFDMTELAPDYEIVDGAELKVFTGTGKISVTGDVTILPAQPKSGWLWDTSRLATEGIIAIVADPTSIGGVRADDLTNAVIYDLAGRRVSKVSVSGTYIVNGKKMYVKK